MDNKLKEALGMYDLTSSKVDLIRHNENVTYKVTDGGNTYVLRIHQPADGFSLDMLHKGFGKLELIQNEMKAIINLACNTDILLQQPIYNGDGDFVAVLSCGTPVTLLSWVEGETLETLEMTGELFFTIGKTIADMHKYLSICNQKYARFSYDQSLLPSISEQICLATMSNALTEPQSQTIHAVIAEIERRLNELDQTGLQKHIVHSDLYKSNIVHNNGVITPIDFSLCGYAHFYLDIAAVLSYCKSDGSKQSLLEGYRSSRKVEINPYFIEPYSALESLLFFACQHKRAHEWDWWHEVVENACEKEFEPLVIKQFRG